MSKSKHLPISFHQTPTDTLQVNWKQEYNDEFICPQCNQGTLDKFQYSRGAACKLRLGCNACDKITYLTCQVRKYPVISIHQTLFGQLQVDWKKEYNSEFICFQCNQGRISRFSHSQQGVHKLKVGCTSCGKYTTLSCQVSPHIYNYRPDLICPNPLCTQIGHNGQKGWIYETFKEKEKNFASNCRCYFCGINFDPEAQSNGSWMGNQNEDKLLSFCFEDDIWDLRHFLEQPHIKTLNFSPIKFQWYRQQVKRYLYFLLKSGIYTSVTVPVNSL